MKPKGEGHIYSTCQQTEIHKLAAGQNKVYRNLLVNRSNIHAIKYGNIWAIKQPETLTKLQKPEQSEGFLV